MGRKKHQTPSKKTERKAARKAKKAETTPVLPPSLTVATEPLRESPAPYHCWGAELIEPAALVQMENALRLPVAVAGALMPDAHVGYGLPIGGVLATRNAVIPYGVGVDIGCRMHLSIFPDSPELLTQKPSAFEQALRWKTSFGRGAAWKGKERPDHAVLDDATWRLVPGLRALQATAHEQLGTSGSGNHFVEWGILTLEQAIPSLGLTPGRYLTLLSHSGSRALGFKVAQTYTKIASQQHPTLPDEVRHLAWLPLHTSAGQEYWQAMELAGRYARANHEVIHERVADAVGLQPLAVVQNHHNFAWREQLEDGTPVIVHRKGATPAGPGVLGIIPGSMGDAGYLVRGKGAPQALNSAAHGAGRAMSRRIAAQSIPLHEWQRYLRQREVTLIGGSPDEAPQAYKPIDAVLAAHTDLIDPLARFTPRIVRMASEAGDY